MKRALFALALAAALPFSASAAERSYSFIELDYAGINIDLGPTSVDENGYKVQGSAAFGDSGFYGTASYYDIKDLSQADLGLGYAHNLSENADLVTELAWRNTDFGVGDGDDVRLSFGVRGNLADSFEAGIKASYIDGDVYDGEFGATVFGQYKFNETWGIAADVEYVDDVTNYAIGVRASF
jgi:hypothetical protein